MQQPSIVVLEEDPQSLYLLSESLAEQGYDLGLCDNAEAADALIRTMWPDLAIIAVDWRDHGEGWKVLKTLWANPTTATFPILAMSVDTELLRWTVACLDLLHIEILEKPFRIDKLSQTVRRMISD